MRFCFLPALALLPQLLRLPRALVLPPAPSSPCPCCLCQVHSLTKWLGGHGTSIGGIVIDSGKFDWGAGKHPMYTEPDPSYHGLRWAIDLPEPLKPLAYKLRLLTGPLRNLGACISPDNSWMALQGIETLSLRMDRHCENALAVAQHLSKHESVEWVRFPGLESDPEYEKNVKYLKGKGGSMVVFGVKGGKEAGSKFIDNLKLISHVANVGSTQSLAIHPATTTHSQLSADAQLAGGIKPVRFPFPSPAVVAAPVTAVLSRGAGLRRSWSACRSASRPSATSSRIWTRPWPRRFARRRRIKRTYSSQSE